MNVSFNGFNENTVTFEANGTINVGAPVMITANGKVSAANGAFCGICRGVRNGYAAAQVRGIDRHKLPAINTNWDPTKTYRQLVVLVEFADFDFNLDNPNATYDSLFNMPGFNKGQGNLSDSAGCRCVCSEGSRERILYGGL